MNSVPVKPGKSKLSGATIVIDDDDDDIRKKSYFKPSSSKNILTNS